MEYGYFFVTLFLFAALILLDCKRRISIPGNGNLWLTALLFPHVYLYFRLMLAVYPFLSLTPSLLFSIYVLFRILVCPVLRFENENARLVIMQGGRRITLIGIWTVGIQTLLYLFFGRLLFTSGIQTSILLEDLAGVLIYIFILLSNGSIRMLLTSKRLRLFRRILFLLTFWIPVWNIGLLLYFCRLVRWEHDHDTYKVSVHKMRADSDLCATRYPILMVHGIGFRDTKYLNYWGRIPRELMRNGATIYYGHQEAMGTIEDNARDIRDKISEILIENNCEKVNIIAHSKGGLDARYMISAYSMGDKVASLTLLGVPNLGSELLDVANRLPDSAYRRLSRMIDAHFRRVGDKNPDCYTSSRQLLPSYVREFNQEVRDDPKVYYQSYALIMKNVFSDLLLSIPYLILYLIAGPNDGLVCVDSAKWGDYKGLLVNRYRRGVSHGDIIDLKREDFEGFDVLEEYVRIANELKAKGY